MQIGGSLEEILHDKSSEMYKNTDRVAIGFRGRMNSAACLPHSIVRVQITG
jgi:hypothetical protein